MITADQNRKLHKAIDAAQGPGMCRYSKKEKPYCVIGQLAFSEGVSGEHLRKMDRRPRANLGAASRIDALDELLPDELKSYPMSLLVRLQAVFDNSSPTRVGQSKDLMHQMVSVAWER